MSEVSCPMGIDYDVSCSNRCKGVLFEVHCRNESLAYLKSSAQEVKNTAFQLLAKERCASNGFSIVTWRSKNSTSHKRL